MLDDMDLEKERGITIKSQTMSTEAAATVRYFSCLVCIVSSPLLQNNREADHEVADDPKAQQCAGPEAQTFQTG